MIVTQPIVVPTPNQLEGLVCRSDHHRRRVEQSTDRSFLSLGESRIWEIYIELKGVCATALSNVDKDDLTILCVVIAPRRDRRCVGNALLGCKGNRWSPAARCHVKQLCIEMI